MNGNYEREKHPINKALNPTVSLSRRTYIAKDQRAMSVIVEKAGFGCKKLQVGKKSGPRNGSAASATIAPGPPE